MILTASACYGQTVNIDDVYYQLAGYYANVTAPPDTVYTGHVKIPRAVEYEGQKYYVRIISGHIFDKVEEITLEPLNMPAVNLFVNDDGPRSPRMLKRLNLASVSDPENYSIFQINLGGNGLTVSAETYYNSPGETVVKINEFNVYGPDGERLKPFLWARSDHSKRVYPDENGRFVLGPGFTIDGEQTEVIPTSNSYGKTTYTIAIFQVEYEGMVANIRVNAAQLNSEPTYVDGSNLEFVIDNSGNCAVAGFKAGADTGVFVSIPDSADFSGKRLPVSSIMPRAFMGSDITGVRIGPAMKEIRWQAFANCAKLEQVEFNGSSCRIYNQALAYCPLLSQITFTGNGCIPSFGQTSLDGTPALKSINLPANSVFDWPIRHLALSGLFESEIIENNDETIKIRFKSGLCDSIGTPIPVCAYRTQQYRGTIDGMEQMVMNIKTFPIENDIITIDKNDLYYETTPGNRRFNGQLSFGYLTQDDPYFSNGVADGEYPSSYHPAIFTRITVPEQGLPDPTDIAGLQYLADGMDNGEITVTATTQNTSEVIIPSVVNINGQSYDVTGIDSGAFAGNSALTEVVIPASVTSIGSNAFAGTSVRNIDLSANSDIRFGENALAGCPSLTTLTLPADQSELPWGFIAGNTGLRTLDIPQGCEVYGILGEDTAPFISTGERCYGPLTVNMQVNDGSNVVLGVQSGLTCGEAAPQVCAYTETDGNKVVYPAIDGYIVIPAADLRQAAPAQARSRAEAAPAVLRLAVYDNNYASAIARGESLLSISVVPADPASVTDIDADASSAPATLYNLQGIPVNAADAAPGIYLLRRGDKVTKTVID